MIIKRKTQEGKPRIYSTPDGDFPSVTSILSALAKHALVPWAVNLEREFCVRVAKDCLRGMVARGTKIDTMNFEHVLRRGLGDKKAHQLYVNEAGSHGTGAHAGAEFTARSMGGGNVLGAKIEESADSDDRGAGVVPMSTESAHAWAEWVAWVDCVDFRPVLVEQPVWSRRHGYAGAFDCLGELLLPTGVRGLALLDWKSGKSIHRESYLQNAAYVSAGIELGVFSNDPPIWGAVVRLPKRAGDPGLEVAWIPPAAQPFLMESFMGVKKAWEFQRANDPLTVYRAGLGLLPVAMDVPRHVELDEEE